MTVSGGGYVRARFTSSHGGLPSVNQKSTCITQSTLEPNAVHDWSRYTLKLRGDETLILRRVGWPREKDETMKNNEGASPESSNFSTVFISQEVLQSRFAKVKSPTNPSTYPSLSLI